MVFSISWPEITTLIASLTQIWVFFLNKVVSSTQFEFSFHFPLFFMYLSSTYGGMWLFINFCAGDSDGSLAILGILRLCKL